MKKNNRFKLDTYKKGGNKSEWISNKISEIMKEGKYPQDQAIAIAYSMYDHMYQDGAIINSHLKNIYDIKQNVYNPSMGHGFQIYYRDPSDPKFNETTDIDFVKNEYLPEVQKNQAYKDFMNRATSNTPFIPTILQGDYEIPKFLPQKKIENINYNVRTEGNRQGRPAGEYTKIYYNDGTYDYIDKQGESTLYQMPNYREYIKRKQQSSTPQLNLSNQVTQYQNGDLVKDKSFSPIIDGVDQPQGMSQEDYYKSLQGAMLTPYGENLRYNASQKTSGEISPFTTEGEMKPTNTNNSTYNQPLQFLNPYSDVDLSTGAQAFGRGLKSGNPLEIIGGGLKTITGLARDVFSGMGQENVKQEGLKNYYDKQRETMIKPTYQEGGEMPQEYQEQTQEHSNHPQEQQEQLLQQVSQALQQGVDPQQIVQQLVQIGISQQQAIAIVQQIAYQLQGQSEQEETMEGTMSNPKEEYQEQTPMMQNGGYYLNQIKGKRIKDYKFNNKTNSYDIEFE